MLESGGNHRKNETEMMRKCGDPGNEWKANRFCV